MPHRKATRLPEIKSLPDINKCLPDELIVICLCRLWPLHIRSLVSALSTCNSFRKHLKSIGQFLQNELRLRSLPMGFENDNLKDLALAESGAVSASNAMRMVRNGGLPRLEGLHRMKGMHVSFIAYYAMELLKLLHSNNAAARTSVMLVLSNLDIQWNMRYTMHYTISTLHTTNIWERLASLKRVRIWLEQGHTPEIPILLSYTEGICNEIPNSARGTERIVLLEARNIRAHLWRRRALEQKLRNSSA